eukprot:TRINITY_DN4642_c0_g1_i1.p1 TRINITY_DN4642_c0_g1~~TRINITY_DN4642_c0_g1_i1.p1  ORF type:complete len:332 (+),score=75.39 TRINITY_DN4642_c0_g1_i1:178-1173(+)
MSNLAGSPGYVIAAKGAFKEPEPTLSANPLQQPISALFPDSLPTIATAKKKDHISKTFKTLIDHKILSCPVFNVAKQNYIGFIDMVDMVTHVINTCQESELMGGELPVIMENQERFTKSLTGNICDLSKRNPWKPVDKKVPISAAVKLMVQWKVHRIPIVDSDGELLTLVTQSQICKFINDHMDAYTSLASKTVGDLNLGLGNVFTVNVNGRAVDAFKIMHDQGVSAVGVVNDEGELIANISVSDLKLIGYDGKLMNALLFPITEFLKLISPNAAFGVGPISVDTSATFKEVVSTLVLARIHRVYVVDKSNNKPIGVISQLEVLKAFHDQQ